MTLTICRTFLLAHSGMVTLPNRRTLVESSGEKCPETRRCFRRMPSRGREYAKHSALLVRQCHSLLWRYHPTGPISTVCQRTQGTTTTFPSKHYYLTLEATPITGASNQQSSRFPFVVTSSNKAEKLSLSIDRMADALQPPRKSVELEDPGAHELSTISEFLGPVLPASWGPY